MVSMQRILEPLVSLKPIKLKCVMQEHFLPYHYWYACVHVTQPETLSVQTTALMMQALWSGSMTLALLHYLYYPAICRGYMVSH